MKKALILVALVLSAFVLVACGDDTIPVVTEYTITFNVDGGSDVASIKKTKDSNLGTLPTPTKAGYTFEGWFSDSARTIEVTSTTAVTANMTLYAKWAAEQTQTTEYIISFNVDGGSTVADLTIEEDTQIGQLPTSTKAGYTFEGWFSDSARTIEVTSTTVVTANMTLYAKWSDEAVTPISFTISFNVDGGSSVADLTREENVEIGQLPTPTKTGFTFDGWYIDSDKTIKVVASLLVTTDLNLYAKWIKDKETFTITFNSNEGSNVNSITELEGTLVSKPTNPTKDGFSFVAWSTDSQGQNIVEWPYEISADITLYAHWNESIPIGTYLTTLLNNFKINVSDILPDKMEAGGKLHNSTTFTTDYSTSVATSNIVYGGYGEQWQMVLENLEQAQMFFNVLNTVDIIASASIVAFNNYLDSNPGTTANHEFTQGIYSVAIDYRDNELVYVIEYSGNIPLVGQQTVQIALIYNVLTGERSGRIQLGTAGALRYTLKDDGFIIASDYLGVRTSYVEVSTLETGVIQGDIFEFMTVSSVTIQSAAQFVISETYATVIGNKANAELGLEGTIVELYSKDTGNLLASEVRETRSLLTFDTLWFNLTDVQGITSIQGIAKGGAPTPGTNPFDIYVNGSVSIFKTKNVSFINPSRRYDIEFRSQYFYKEVEGNLERIEVLVPMLFVQASHYNNAVTDVKAENSYLTNFNITMNATVLAKLQSDYEINLPIFDENKENMTPEIITIYIGSMLVIENE